MSSPVATHRRRVIEAEAALVNERLALRERAGEFAARARAAATPGRIVVGGLGLGVLVGLLGGRRNGADTRAAPGPGLLRSLIGTVRMASLVMPMLAPLLSMAQNGVAGSDSPHDAPADPPSPPPDAPAP